MEIHNFPMPVGPIISPAPLFVCLTHGTVDVLASSCSGQVLWECWTLRSLHPPSLAVCRPHQWLLLLWDLELWIWLEPGTGSCLSQSFCAQLFPPGHSLKAVKLSRVCVQDVGWRRRREPWCKCCAEQAGNANVNGREGWLLLHLVSVFWEVGKLGKGDKAGVELF